MAITNLTINTIADSPVANPMPITPPAPWPVGGTVEFGGGTATQITGMGYQIEEGPVIGFAPPSNANNPTDYSFTLTGDDIPANGQYLLTVYAWDDDNPSGSGTVTAQIQCSNLAPITSIPKGCCS